MAPKCAHASSTASEYCSGGLQQQTDGRKLHGTAAICTDFVPRRTRRALATDARADSSGSRRTRWSRALEQLVPTLGGRAGVPIFSRWLKTKPVAETDGISRWLKNQSLKQMAPSTGGSR